MRQGRWIVLFPVISIAKLKLIIVVSWTNQQKNQPTNQITNKPTKQWTIKPTKTTNQRKKQTNKLTNPSTNKTNEQTIERTYQPTNKPTNKQSQKGFNTLIWMWFFSQRVLHSLVLFHMYLFTVHVGTGTNLWRRDWQPSQISQHPMNTTT